MKTLTANPANIQPVQFPEDTTNGVDGDDRNAASLEGAIQQLYNRIGLLELQQIEVGDTIMRAGNFTSTKYLECDGAAYSRTTYAALFAKIGILHGAGNGTSTFNVPDVKDFFPMGASTLHPVGTTGGGNDVTLNAGQIPTHNHAITVDANGAHTHTGSASNAGAHTHTADVTPDGAHTHTASNSAAGAHTHGYHGSNEGGDGLNDPILKSGTGAFSPPAFNPIEPVTDHTHVITVNNVANHDHNISVDGVADHTHSITVNSGGSHAHTASSANVGGSLAHENRPAFKAFKFMIRAL